MPSHRRLGQRNLHHLRTALTRAGRQLALAGVTPGALLSGRLAGGVPRRAFGWFLIALGVGFTTYRMVAR